MAVIAVTATDTGEVQARWEVPPDTILNMSPVPRGIREYIGTAAVLALGAGDETNVGITFVFPTAFMYLPKTLTCQFLSDDLTTEFENIGGLEYQPGGSAAVGTRVSFEMLSDGSNMRSAIRSEQNYRPMGTWRRWIDGPAGDLLAFSMADISGDTSTAGDVIWAAEFWEYDVEQCLKWPVNTPQPVVSYGN